jgi:hypothetical protein
LLDLQEKAPEVLVTLDDLVEGLSEGLHFFAFVVTGLFEAISKLLFEVNCISREVTLVHLLSLVHGRVRVSSAF